MEREERRRKFHESLKQILFPPPATSPSSPPPHGFNIEELVCSNTHVLIPDEFSGFKTSSCSEDERECGPKNLTRAQRKRVRKKKMKEYTKRRNGLIGPLWDVPVQAEGVRQNASQKLCIENDRAAPCTNQSKVKNRRRAKKLAKEKPKSFIAEKSQQDCDSVES